MKPSDRIIEMYQDELQELADKAGAIPGLRLLDVSACAKFIVAKLNEAVVAEIARTEALVASLPTCDTPGHEDRPATKSYRCGGPRYCDSCDDNGHAVPDYPRAQPLRDIASARVGKGSHRSHDPATVATFVRAWEAYVTQHGIEHDGCPEGDTCECALVLALNVVHADIIRASKVAGAGINICPTAYDYSAITVDQCAAGGCKACRAAAVCEQVEGEGRGGSEGGR